jgi:hypothetical protein
MIAIVGVTAARSTTAVTTRAPGEATTIATATSTMGHIVGHQSVVRVRSTMTLNKMHLKVEKVCVNLTQRHRVGPGHDRCHQRIKFFR